MKIKARNNKLYLHFSHDGQMVRKSMKMEDTAKNRTIIQKQIIPEIQKQLLMGEFFQKQNKLSKLYPSFCYLGKSFPKIFLNNMLL